MEMMEMINKLKQGNKFIIIHDISFQFSKTPRHSQQTKSENFH